LATPYVSTPAKEGGVSRRCSRNSWRYIREEDE